MNLASSDHYPVNREFALDVCHLPTAYSQAEYMKFIEDWGTVNYFLFFIQSIDLSTVLPAKSGSEVMFVYKLIRDL